MIHWRYTHILCIILYILQCKNLLLQVDQEMQRRTLLQNDIKTHLQTITHLRNAEKQMDNDMALLKEGNKGVGHELRRVKE